MAISSALRLSQGAVLLFVIYSALREPKHFRWLLGRLRRRHAGRCRVWTRLLRQHRFRPAGREQHQPERARRRGPARDHDLRLRVPGRASATSCGGRTSVAGSMLLLALLMTGSRGGLVGLAVALVAASHRGRARSLEDRRRGPRHRRHRGRVLRDVRPSGLRRSARGGAHRRRHWTLRPLGSRSGDRARPAADGRGRRQLPGRRGALRNPRGRHRADRPRPRQDESRPQHVPERAQRIGCRRPGLLPLPRRRSACGHRQGAKAAPRQRLALPAARCAAFSWE